MTDAAASHNRRRIHRLLSGVGLLATASAASLLSTADAQAACTISNGSPPNAVTANAQIVCQGNTTGQSFTGNGDGIVFLQVGNGGFLGNSSVDLTGFGVLIFAEEALITDTALRAIGPVAGIQFVDMNAANVTLTVGGGVGGSSGYISLQNTQLLAAGGSIQLQDDSQFYMDSATAITATSNGGIVNGGSGNNLYSLYGALTAGADGILVSDSGGSNTYQFGSATVLSTANASTLFILGGSGQDNIQLNGANNLTFNSTNVEALTVNGATGGVFTLGGAHDFSQVLVMSGALAVSDFASLGQSTSQVFINQGAELRAFMASGSHVSNNEFIGSGALTFDMGGATITLNGQNTNFEGLLTVNGGLLELGNSYAAGTADIVLNNALLMFGGVGTEIANNISGSGVIQYTGSSTTVGFLTGQNTHAGGVQITNGGALYINGAANLGSGNVFFANGGRLWIDATSSQTIANTIGGDAMLHLTGNVFTVELNGANTYSGGTYIQSGALRVSDLSQLGTGGVIVETNAALDLNITSAYTYGGSGVAGNGFLRKSGLGDLTLTGNALNGGLDIVAGQVLIDSFGALGAGPTQVGSGASLVFNSANAQTWNASIFGAGTFRKLGAGDLTIASPFTIGALSIEGGSILLNSTASTNATVFANASLLGGGVVTGNLVNNGTVAPGNSIGTLTVNGNYTHGANAILEIEFDGSGGIDLLDIEGTATLNGGTLRFISLGGAEGMGGTFLRADGGITGTFATIETVGAALPLTVTYGSNEASMTPTVLSARPSTFNAQILAAADTGFGFIDRIANATHRADGNRHVWAEGFSTSADRSAQGATLGYSHDGGGVSTGVTVDLSPKLSVGAAIGLTRSDIELDNAGGKGEQDGVLGSVHARYGAGALAFTGGLLLGHVDQSTTRNVSFNNFFASIDAETSSSLVGGFAGASVDWGDTEGWRFGGAARVSLIRQTQDAYNEAGTSALRLNVAEVEVDTVEGQAGLSAARHFDAAEGGLTLKFGAGLRYLDADKPDIAVTFAQSNASLVLQGDARDSAHGYVEAGGAYVFSHGVMLRAGYAGQIGDSERHEARLGVSVAF
ncbi:MAG: autotransporter domain-containing protein [Hyphomonadaceae bacterium]|nr:autotransporter domain-containing protein [Hyphomonadaceae bacterium]